MSEVLRTEREAAGSINAPPFYTFNASALALGGFFRRANNDKPILVPSLASVSLSSSGGEGAAMIDNYDQDGVSFTRASSRVTGYEVSPNKFTTIANVQISNLNVDEAFQIAFMEATLTSDREVLTRDPDKEAHQNRTRFEVRVMYRGIVINGKEVLPEFDAEIVTASAYSDFAHVVRTKVSKNDANLISKVEERSGAIRGSVIALAHRDGRKHGLHGRRIPVEGIGHAHLGELAVKPDRRRLSLFRLDFKGGAFARHDEGELEPRPLASAQAPDAQPMLLTMADGDGYGTLSGGDTNTNGAPIWP